MDQETCEVCGSVYEITSTNMTMRDKDKIDCEVCGVELLRWNAAVFYSATLIKRGAPPQPSN